MADEWAVEDTDAEVEQIATSFELPTSDLPEIKLFGKWSLQEVNSLLSFSTKNKF